MQAQCSLNWSSHCIKSKSNSKYEIWFMNISCKNRYQKRKSNAIPLRCDINNQEDLPLIDAEINIISLSILEIKGYIHFQSLYEIVYQRIRTKSWLQMSHAKLLKPERRKPNLHSGIPNQTETDNSLLQKQMQNFLSLLIPKHREKQ